MSSAPVKAEVRGSKTLPNGTIYNVYHVYDFFNYRPGIDDVDDTTFQVIVILKQTEFGMFIVSLFPDRSRTENTLT